MKTYTIVLLTILVSFGLFANPNLLKSGKNQSQNNLFVFNNQLTDDDSVLFYRNDSLTCFKLKIDGFEVIRRVEGSSKVYFQKFYNSNPKNLVKISTSNKIPLNIYKSESFKSSYQTEIVKLNNFYPGVNLKFYFDKDGYIEYDYEAEDINYLKQIKFKSNFKTDYQELISANKMAIYQTKAILISSKKTIELNTIKGNNNITTFDFSKLPNDIKGKVTIDPKIIYSTYVGGSSQEIANYATYDAKGNYYFSGYSQSSNYPTKSAYQSSNKGSDDVFLTKFDSTGKIKWSTYYGGSSSELLAGANYNRNNKILLVGSTYSTDFPVTSGAFQTKNNGGADGYFVVFDTSGKRQYASYYGGSNDDAVNTVNIDTLGNIFMAGSSASSNFPIKNAFQKTIGGGQDGIILKLDTSFKIVKSTFYGGSNTDFFLYSNLDFKGNFVIAGTSGSTNFPVKNALQKKNGGGLDGMIVKLDSSLKPIWSTYYGGGNDERIYNIELDNCENVYATGYTTGTCPTTSGAFQTKYGGGSKDALLVKVDAGGALQWSTLYGGSSVDVFQRCAADIEGNLWVAGFTGSTNYNVTSGCLQSTNGGGYDVGFVKFSPAGKVLYASYFGGSSDEVVGQVNTFYNGQFTIMGYTYSSDFPTKGTPYQSSNKGSVDGFYFKMQDYPRPKVLLGDSKTTCDNTTYILCPNDSILIYTKTLFPNYHWSNGDNRYFTYLKKAGKYYLSVIIGGVAVTSDTLVITMAVAKNPTINPISPKTICNGDSLKISVKDSFRLYTWSTGDTAKSIYVKKAGKYTATVRDSNYCYTSSDFDLKLDSTQIKISSGIINNTLCLSKSGFIDVASGFSKISWNTGDTSHKIIISKKGKYKVTGLSPNLCKVKDSININLDSTFISLGSTKNPINKCIPDTAKLTPFTNSKIIYWSKTDSTVPKKVIIPGFYKAYFKTSNGCSDTVNYIIKNYPNNRIKIINPSVSGLACGKGGSSIYLDSFYKKIKWSTGDTSKSIRIVKTGTYSVSAIDGNHCRSYDTTSLKLDSSKISIGKIVKKLPICPEDSVNLTYISDFSTNKWNTGDTAHSIIAKKAGKYVVYGTNLSGCKDSAIVNINIKKTNPIKIQSSKLNKILCKGETLSLFIDSTQFSQLKWNYNYLSSNKIQVSQNSLYKITGLDTGGCTVKDSILISKDTANLILLSSISNAKHCVGDSILVQVYNGFSSILWSNGYKSNKFYYKKSSNLSAIASNSDGCKDSLSIKIEFYSNKILRLNSTSNKTFCYFDSISENYQVNNAKQFLYWMNGSKNPNITVTKPIKVFAVAIDSNGCKDTTNTVNITRRVNYTPLINPNPSFKCYYNPDVKISTNSFYKNYYWNGIDSGKNSIFANKSGKLQVRDSFGCLSDTISYFVKSYPKRKINYKIGDSIICLESAYLLNYQNDSFKDYRWSDGTTTMPKQINNETHNLFLIATNKINGCIDSSMKINIYRDTLIVKPTFSLSDTVFSFVPKSFTAINTSSRINKLGFIWAINKLIDSIHPLSIDFKSLDTNKIIINLTSINKVTGCSSSSSKTILFKSNSIYEPQRRVLFDMLGNIIAEFDCNEIQLRNYLDNLNIAQASYILTTKDRIGKIVNKKIIYQYSK